MSLHCIQTSQIRQQKTHNRSFQVYSTNNYIHVFRVSGEPEIPKMNSDKHDGSILHDHFPMPSQI